MRAPRVSLSLSPARASRDMTVPGASCAISAISVPGTGFVTAVLPKHLGITI
jgi:hypothetical protein